ncbi:hypothetical protein [Methanosarcina horonobensis]|uniref:hypothetical protein n=1 Tax=Methanosarcina horonobensis TaxID=418008 RepID=UPI000A4F1CAA|nr:hypothetical protein [Methanosarcina horonobensis]
MTYANLSQASISDLRSITQTGKVSPITVNKYRENIEKKTLRSCNHPINELHSIL